MFHFNPSAMKRILFISVLIPVLFSCSSGDEKKTTEDGPSTDESSACSYTCVVDSTTRVSWLAYKYTNKVGVGGRFTDYKVSGLQEGESVAEAIENASITIDVSSTNTKDPLRDQNIIDAFFGVMIDTEKITGSVKEVKDDGTGLFTLTMNGKTGDLPMTYELAENQLTLMATLNVDKWEAQAAIDSLNIKCKGNHTGEDGVMKLWSDVDVKITTPVKKTCE